MRTYAVGLLFLCLVLSVGARLFYDRRYSSVTGLLFSLILLSSIAAPLCELPSLDTELSLPEISVDVGLFEEELSKAYSEGIARAVAEKFLLDVSDVSVEVSKVAPERIREAEVCVCLTGRAALADPHAVREYLIVGGVNCREVKIGSP